MSFFERQPPLFDTKKRLAAAQQSTTAGAAPPPSSTGERSHHQSGTQAAATTDDLESQYGLESWTELAPSRTSLCSSVEVVDRDGGEPSGLQRDSRMSPISIKSPPAEMQPNLDDIKQALNLLPPSTKSDYILDWSSRPEQLAPSRLLLRNRNGQISSALTTPPNSPELVNSDFEYKTGTKPKRWVFYRFEVVVGLLVTNIVTLFVGATLGYYVCKRFQKNYHSW